MKKEEIIVGRTYERSGALLDMRRKVLQRGPPREFLGSMADEYQSQDWVLYARPGGYQSACTAKTFATWAQQDVTDDSDTPELTSHPRVNPPSRS